MAKRGRVLNFRTTHKLCDEAATIARLKKTTVSKLAHDGLHMAIRGRCTCNASGLEKLRSAVQDMISEQLEYQEIQSHIERPSEVEEYYKALSDDSIWLLRRVLQAIDDIDS